jgi:hypothetical protein
MPTVGTFFLLVTLFFIPLRAGSSFSDEKEQKYLALAPADQKCCP